MLIAGLRQSEVGVSHATPEGQPVPLYPIWDTLRASKLGKFDKSAARMMPARVT